MPIYTDERIAADLNGISAGYRRAAEYLVPFTPEERDVIVADARYMMNCTQTRYSDAVASCADAYKAKR